MRLPVICIDARHAKAALKMQNWSGVHMPSAPPTCALRASDRPPPAKRFQIVVKNYL